MDWSYETSTGDLRIERVRGTDRSTEIVVYRHRGDEFGLGNSRITRPIGALFCNAIFGAITLRRQRGRFRFGDATVEIDVEFLRDTTVHYDGANGALDAAPADGSLILDAVRSVEPSGAVVLEVRPPAGADRIAWQQVRGPRLGVRGARSPRVRIESNGLGSDDLAAFLVGANLGRAVALDTVFVRPAAR